MLRYKVRVHLGVFCSTLRGKQEYRLLMDDNGNVPNEILYGPHEVGDVLRKISNKLLSVDPEWLDIRFSNISNKEVGDSRELHINYGVVVPQDLDLKSGRWVSFKDFMEQEDENNQGYHEILSNISLMIL